MKKLNHARHTVKICKDNQPIPANWSKSTSSAKEQLVIHSVVAAKHPEI